MLFEPASGLCYNSAMSLAWRHRGKILMTLFMLAILAVQYHIFRGYICGRVADPSYVCPLP
jgi:hypothetical protein